MTIQYLSDMASPVDFCPDLGSIALNQSFSTNELNQALTQVNSKSSPGADDIAMSMLVNLPEQAKSILLQSYNQCWSNGFLPRSWNHSLINPILKHGNEPKTPFSYRPISLTSAASKVMERLVANRLNWYLETYNLINPIQAGFQKNHCTLDHAIRLKSEAENVVSSGNITVAIFLDFSRAFDLVWTDGPLMKLLKLHINGNCLNYIKNFLENRSAEVMIGGTQSASYI